ncbi:MAG: nucleotidyltransferase domain-containing protein [Candidatus Woesearchaeota archaeon]
MEKYINNHIIGLYKPIKWFKMITEKQLKIFEVFVKKPFLEYTRNEIKKISKEKSNNKLNSTINLLKKEQVILEKNVGKSGILTLNLNNDLTYYYIALCNEKSTRNLKSTIDEIKKEISQITSFYSLVIFGSYADGTQTKSSDLDIAIFIEDDKKIKNIKANINMAKLKILIDVDFQIISKKEMIEMLINKEENLGKQIVKKHAAIYNHKIFYDIITEALNYGFRI